MVTPPVAADQERAFPTVNPRALSKTVTHNPHGSKRFNPDEWENWMQWDGALDSFSPKSLSDESNGSVRGGSLSNASTSPSETESLQLLPLAPIYRIPSIDDGNKFAVPNIEHDASRQPTKKRKTSARTDVQETRTRQPKGQKISHNVIEKRYRTNLNDKIARLRDSVPVLKTAFEASQKQTTKPDAESGSDDSGSDDKAALGLKFNKATVLTKATEYIEQLEKANARLSNENSTLRRRARDDTSDVNAPKPLYFRADEATSTGTNLAVKPKQVTFESNDATPTDAPESVSGKIPVAADFQRLRAEAADQPSYAPSAPTPESLSPCPTTLDTETAPSTPATAPGSELIDFDSVKGSIPVSEYVTRNRVPISQQQHYAPPMDGTRNLDPADDPFILDDEEPRAWWPRHRASKLLLGSLAGLMIMEGFNANVESTKPAPPPKHPPPHRRGLISLPDDFYTESRGFRAQIRQRIIDFANSSRGQQALPMLMLAAVILSIALAGLIYWSRKDLRGRRRVSSIGANLESNRTSGPAGEPVDESKSGFFVATMKPSLQIQDKLGPEIASSNTKSFFSEAGLRIKGCWHILTTGESFYRDSEEEE